MQSPHEIVKSGNVRPRTDLLAAIRQRKGTTSASPIVDFTFRLRRHLRDRIADMAQAEGCSSNAMVAALVGAGLEARGQKSLAEQYPDYVRYLARAGRYSG